MSSPPLMLAWAYEATSRRTDTVEIRAAKGAVSTTNDEGAS